MSQQSLTAFFTKLADDPELARRMHNVVEQNEGPQAVAAVGDLAREAGYDVDDTEVASFRASALRSLRTGELSETDLEAVAGGTSGTEDLLGVIGGAISLATGAGGLALNIGSAVGTVGKAAGDGMTDFFSKW